MDAAAGAEVLVEHQGPVSVITINRPAQRNAVNAATAALIAQALDDLDRHPDLLVGVITGAGGNFCAGMDLKAFARGESTAVAGRGFAGIVEAPPAKPLIAAVEGWALGGGFEIALACDLVVAGRSARFGLPEVSRGLAARGGGCFRLPRRLPYALAMEAILTGQPIDSDRAERFGLVNQVTEDGAALSSAIELANSIAVNAPLAVQASKRIVVESADWARADAFERQRVQLAPVFASEDAQEGAAAFAERRPPVWRGR